MTTDQKHDVSSDKMVAVIAAIANSQPPVWQFGITICQRFVATLLQSTEGPNKTLASMLLCHQSVVKMEGYAYGVCLLQEAVLKLLGDIDTVEDPRALLQSVKVFLEMQHVEIRDQAPQLYSGVMHGFVQQSQSIPIVPDTLTAECAALIDTFIQKAISEGT